MNIASDIHNKTGYSQNEIIKILNSLGDVIINKISHAKNEIELKIFPGLKISSKYITPNESKSNLEISDCNYILNIKAVFTDDFRKKIRKLHNQ